ncbi:MAG: NAD(P)H-hydrate dehydratase [Bordetella sp.]|nr:MAG: NAD(P)H-hydrate dehydratase [Bordetella sp.]
MILNLQYINPDILPTVFKKRNSSANKGCFGTICILGGGIGMVGAPLLAGRAALKTGAGKVLIGFAQKKTPLNCDILYPELMLSNAMYWLKSNISINVWVAGCGLGQSNLSKILLNYLIKYQNTPLVLDADGLNLLAKRRISINTQNNLRPIVLTPHPVEASRLLNLTVKQIQSDREGSALALSKLYKSWIVLKGKDTIICQPDGLIMKNTTGNVGLATSGTGDVLSGIIGSLIAQNISLEEAVPGAVWLHGAAADLLVSQGIGPIGLTAGELSEAVRKLRNQ